MSWSINFIAKDVSSALKHLTALETSPFPPDKIGLTLVWSVLQSFPESKTGWGVKVESSGHIDQNGNWSNCSVSVSNVQVVGV